MTEMIEEIKTQVGGLTSQERAELAYFLICSLDGEEEDPDVEVAWDVELDRRAAEIESGKAVGRPASQVFAELRRKHP